ncbi:hypothetical protein WA171_007230 [Blastocystis sp. BT1]
MNKCIDSLSNTEDRKIQWKYTGKFLQIGEVIYKNPVSGAIQTYECIRRITKTQIVDGVLILPILKGSKYKEPHVLLIHCYRPAFETYVMSLPAGLVDPGETPLDASLRELKEETGYTGTHMNLDLSIPYYSDPWKSNEQQMLYIVEVDMDRKENQCPQQHLEESEDIKTEIIPISQLLSVVHENLEKGQLVSSPLYMLSITLSSQSIFDKIDQVLP